MALITTSTDANHRRLNHNTLTTKAVGEDDFDNQYSDLAQYGKARFWDHRYTVDTEPFDWYYGYEKYKELVNEFIPKELRIMIAGCGNGHFIEDMADDGYDNLIGIDISRVVISQMEIRCKDFDQISFQQKNLLDSNLPDNSFDAIIDKALFDSILCSPAGGEKMISVYIFEIDRLLSDDGVFFLVSYGNPDDRLKYLEQYDIEEPYFTTWYIEVRALEVPLEYEDEELDEDSPDNYYFVYVCRKDAELVRMKKEALTAKEKKDRLAGLRTRKGAIPL